MARPSKLGPSIPRPRIPVKVGRPVLVESAAIHGKFAVHLNKFKCAR